MTTQASDKTRAAIRWVDDPPPPDPVISSPLIEAEAVVTDAADSGADEVIVRWVDGT